MEIGRACGHLTGVAKALKSIKNHCDGKARVSVSLDDDGNLVFEAMGTRKVQTKYHGDNTSLFGVREVVRPDIRFSDSQCICNAVTRLIVQFNNQMKGVVGG